ncbi:unnamed protein product [Bemisia tabaci]|uniref:Cytochrome c oxidase assembly protein COX20, mitochondrial n=1 Tax=Bemisia tabaci TaxID=7038 RepID=A0A9P0F0K2_BEMTA|nr:PREDICTED: cytochrome c oxidase protein 20 homolog [Bemisia tabaci]XP_018916771.1 PREDICTED: cytochrome c oxidase protein 20 homolog [Bemisia tabaci]CAH0386844.1 unnamed protein product [Bemisia tabaci]
MAPKDPATISRGPEHDIFFLGRNLTEFPCFRSSLLTGVFSAIAGGVAYFLYSSRPAHSCNAAMATFGVSTMCYWTVCRYGYYKQKVELLEIEQKRKETQSVKKLDIEQRKKELGIKDDSS